MCNLLGAVLGVAFAMADVLSESHLQGLHC